MAHRLSERFKNKIPQFLAHLDMWNNELFSIDLRRYFKEYKDGKVYYFSGGRTSWSSITSEYTTPDKVKLAGGDDEN